MKLNKYIDHTYLKAFGSKEDIDKLCEEAIKYDFASCCINPTWVKYVKEKLVDSDVLVCTVIGFPLGANTKEVKAFETMDAIKNGADEIDMVINIGAVKDKRYDDVYDDIKAVVNAANKTLVKVIIETCYLTDDEKRIVSELAMKAGADFIKTSTGFGTNGATKEDILLMKSIAKDKGVKASGGVKTPEDLRVMIEAGASRIGTSSGVSLVNGEDSESEY